MRRFRTNATGVEQGSVLLFSDFKDDGQMWTGDGPRELRHPVIFAEPFKTVPLVHVALGMWDMDRRTNPRMDIGSDEVTEGGFTIVFRTWGDSRIARVRADWFAFGEARDEDDWDVD